MQIQALDLTNIQKQRVLEIFYYVYFRKIIIKNICLIQVKNRAWSPSLLPFPPSRFLHRTVLYCTVLYSPLFILQKLTCFESHGPGETASRHAPQSSSPLSRLLSLLRAESSCKVVFTWLHDSKKRPGILDTWTLLKRTTAQDKITMKRNQST